MKFRSKITLAMLLLMTFLFTVGGTALISISFYTALEREEKVARENSQLLLETIQVVDKIDLWTDEQKIRKMMEKLTEQERFCAVRFSTGEDVIYAKGKAEKDFIRFYEQIEPGKMKVAHINDSQGMPYLQTTTCFKVGEKMWYLSLGYDLSEIYQVREQQEKTYVWIFLVLILFCSVFSYILSKLLTKSMDKLSQATREIASGNLSCRSNICSNDEIGELSKGFDVMAEQVEESVAELQESVKRQQMFMENFTHELKTPMTSILGYAELIKNEILTKEEQTEAASYIFSEGKRLENLSMKLLDIFVADNNKIKMELVSPKELIKSMAAYLQPVYEKENIKIICRGEEGKAFMDIELVQTLLLNILDNARKALESGGTIQICSYMLQDGCRFTITDNGKGIPKDALRHLTEAFYRVDKARSRAQGGVGLGLALCSKIVKMHHGSLMFKSKVGKGTRVIVELRGGCTCHE